MLKLSRFAYLFAWVLVINMGACDDDGGNSDPEVDAAPPPDAAPGSAVASLTADYVDIQATFTPDAAGGATAVLVATDTFAGVHGVRIHTGTCDAPGEVWELGDLGDMEIDSSSGHLGDATYMTSNEMWTVGDGASTDVVGKVLIVYGGEGETNGEMGCGAITQ